MTKWLSLYLTALRPVQWTKNFFVLAAVFFSKSLFDPHAVITVIIAFFLFCLVSGCTYIFNDLCDRDSDRIHPVKSKRPIASGEIGLAQAIVLLIICLAIALTGAYFVNKPFFIVCCVAIVVQVLYSLALKKIVILDVFIIAVAFVLRVVAGAVAIDVEISSWILICTLLLALFLALGKRRHELVMVASGVTNNRKVLEEYSSQLLDQMTSIVAASTVISYALYTVSESTKLKFHTQSLIFTIPFVLYGIFRYLYLIHTRQQGGYPENILITDKPLYINIVLWTITAGIILYVK
jgi:4-hydroxybenzoate polyprenyltransferase